MLPVKRFKHEEWPLHNCVSSPCCLPLVRDLWSDTHPSDIISLWHDDWKLALVVNSSLVDDHTTWHPRFDLPLCHWSWINRFRTNQDHCASCRQTWASQRLKSVTWQATMSAAAHRSQAGLWWHHSANDVAVLWPMTYTSWMHRTATGTTMAKREFVRRTKWAVTIKLEALIDWLS